VVAPDGPFASTRGITPQVIERKDPGVLPDLSGLLAAGDLSIAVSSTLPLSRAGRADRLLAAGAVAGKIVLLAQETDEPDETEEPEDGTNPPEERI